MPIFRITRSKFYVLCPKLDDFQSTSRRFSRGLFPFKAAFPNWAGVWLMQQKNVLFLRDLSSGENTRFKTFTLMLEYIHGTFHFANKLWRLHLHSFLDENYYTSRIILWKLPGVCRWNWNRNELILISTANAMATICNFVDFNECTDLRPKTTYNHNSTSSTQIGLRSVGTKLQCFSIFILLIYTR